MTRTAIASIETDNGTMIIYYNGSGEYLTAERWDAIETIEDGRPESIDEACELARILWGSDPSNVWGFRSFMED